jgi:ABC-type xylose transport system permease subunit
MSAWFFALLVLIHGLASASLLLKGNVPMAVVTFGGMIVNLGLLMNLTG